MKELTIQQWMELIERICLDMNPDEDNELGNLCYMISHCFSTTCENPHTDWKKEIVELYDNYK